MIQHNDAKAALNNYERTLFQSKMPRVYWKHLVKNISFLDYQVCRTIYETILDAPGKKTKKPAITTQSIRPLASARGSQQADNWKALASGVQVWNPKGPSVPTATEGASPESHISLYCCENLQQAQWAMYTMMHYMLSGIYKKSERPYRVETVRTFELLDMARIEDTQVAPNVVFIPTITADCSAAQAQMVSELMSTSYRILACTTLRPQEFFDKFGYLPYPTFYINEIQEIQSVDSFLAAKEGAK